MSGFLCGLVILISTAILFVISDITNENSSGLRLSMEGMLGRLERQENGETDTCLSDIGAPARWGITTTHGISRLGPLRGEEQITGWAGAPIKGKRSSVHGRAGSGKVAPDSPGKHDTQGWRRAITRTASLNTRSLQGLSDDEVHDFARSVWAPGHWTENPI